MKKVMMMCLMLGLLVPAFAEDKCKGEACPASRGDCPAFAAKQHDGKKVGEFKKARKEHKKKMKATEEKVEKLVEEYKKLKSGKKKDAKKAEIAAVVSSIRDEQIKFKEGQLKRFQERLEKMQKKLAEEKTEKAKADWVDRKTDELIAEDGDLEVLFEKEGPRVPKFAGKDMPKGKHPKGHRPAHGEPLQAGLEVPPAPAK